MNATGTLQLDYALLLSRDEINQSETPVQDQSARHKEALKRFIVLRAQNVERRKRRRLSAPATLGNAGGRVSDKQSKTRAPLQTGSETESESLDPNSKMDASNNSGQPASASTPPRRASTGGNDTSREHQEIQNTQLAQEEARANQAKNSVNDNHPPSVAGKGVHAQASLGDFCDAFEECDIEDDEEARGFDVPPPALTACLDENEWEVSQPAVMESEREPPRPNVTAAIPNRTAMEVNQMTKYSMAVDLGVLRGRLNAVLSWEKMVAFLAICGRAPYSAEQYSLLQSIVASLTDGERLHEYKTVRRQMSSNLSEWCFPKSDVYFVHNIGRPRGTSVIKTVKTVNAGRKPAQACVRIIMPSEWAKLDIATFTFYSDVYEHPRKRKEDHLTIENSAIVQRRAPFIGREANLWVWFKGVPAVANERDVVSIPCAARPTQAEQSRIVDEDWFDGAEAVQGGQWTNVRAVVCGVWVVGRIPHLGERRPPPTPPPSQATQWSEHERALQLMMAAPSPSDDAMETVLESESTGKRKRVLGTADPVHTQTRLSYSTNVVKLNPGDTCVLFRSLQTEKDMRRDGFVWVEKERTQHCVLVGSLVRQGVGLSAERLIWLDVTDKDGDRPVVSYVGVSNVTDMPSWLEGYRGDPLTGCTSDPPKNSGHMADGQRYVVYRFALYMDGFKQTKSLGDTRSVGGCYLIPLGLSLNARRGTAAPHVITLASASLPHNEVLNMVMEDISRAASTGVDGVDPFGRRVRIFLDPVTFFGDYPAAAMCADVVGHVGNAFCTHCSVTKRQGPSGSSIVSIQNTHSRRVGFMRTDDRIEAIRSSPLRDSVLKKIGIKSKDKNSRDTLPLVNLSNRLRQATAERNDENEEVIPMMFESSLSCAAVPDHMFNGLIKNLLTVSFATVADNNTRRRLEKRIHSTARENGLPLTGHILRWGSQNEYKGLLPQTMTGFKCLLIASAPAFDDIFSQTGNMVFSMVRMLQKLVAAVYHWPNHKLDGVREDYMSCGEERLQYYSKLQHMVRKYLSACDEVMERSPEAGAILDKPNAHRCLELVTHTIPTFGHARNCSEMVLELMHQVFKRWLERNTHQDSHLTAVERALAKDWMGRVYALYMIWCKGNSRERACSEVCLCRLTLGEEGMILDDRQQNVGDFQREFHTALTSALRGATVAAMEKCGHIKLPSAQEAIWCVNRMDKLKSCDEHVSMQARAGLKLLEKKYRLRVGWGARETTQYRVARLQVRDKYEGTGNSYRYNEAEAGQVVSVVCNEGKEVIEHDDSPVGDLCFFAVYAIFQMSRDKTIWAVCRRMQSTSEGRYRVGGDVVVIELGSGVRRAGAAHICDDNCVYRPRSMDVKHSKTVCAGGLYELWCRADGYPPYMG